MMMIRFRTNLSRSMVAVCMMAAVWTAVAQSTPSFTLKLSVDKPEFRAGDEVEIAIVQTNISDHEIDTYNSSVNGVDNAYSYDIRNEDGNAIAKVPWTKSVPPPESYHEGGIGPGQSVIEGIYISHAFKLDKPGKYTIQVSRPDPDTKDSDGNPVKVYSNTITITITG